MINGIGVEDQVYIVSEGVPKKPSSYLLSDIEAVTTRLEVWRSSDHVGKPLLIHVYAVKLTSNPSCFSRASPSAAS